ncbi:BatD family protein, partial [Candidatus Marithrix sp. Canyon 246]
MKIYKLFLSLLCLSQSLFAEPAAEIFLKTSVTPESNYVQAQFIYSLRLYYRVPIDSGQFSKLEIENAHVELLGKDSTFKTQYEGLEYEVRERRYAIFADGSFTIPAMEFNGMLSTADSECDSLFEYCIGEEVSFNSEPLEFDVKAKAYDDKLWWLPAEDVSLEEQWVLKQPFFQVGEPVIRRLKLKSKALVSEFLPKLSVPNVVDISSYSEPPKRKNKVDKDGVIGRLEQEVVLVANSAGYYKLPAIELVWWDTINNKQRVVSLPAHNIYVRSANEGLWWLWFWQILSAVLGLL